MKSSKKQQHTEGKWMDASLREMVQSFEGRERIQLHRIAEAGRAVWAEDGEEPAQEVAVAAVYVLCRGLGLSKAQLLYVCEHLAMLVGNEDPDLHARVIDHVMEEFGLVDEEDQDDDAENLSAANTN